MARYAYSLDKVIWVGSFSSREEACDCAASDGGHEPGSMITLYTAERGCSPRVGSFVPNGRELVEALIGDAVDGAEPQAEVDTLLAKLRGLPPETHERFQGAVAAAVDGWVGALGLQPRWFPVRTVNTHRVLVQGKREAST